MSDKKYIVSPEYPNGVLVDLNAQEIAQRETDAIKAETDKVAREEKIATELARKESAIAKLKVLGLTEEEVNSIL
jgi:hypothetical protein